MRISGTSLVVIVVTLTTSLAICTLFGSILHSRREQIRLQNSCAINTREGFGALLTLKPIHSQHSAAVPYSVKTSTCCAQYHPAPMAG